MAKTTAKSSTKKSNVVPIKKAKPNAAPVATAKSTTKAPVAAKKKTAENGKFIGKSSGMRVQAFQDKLMKDNYKAKLTDAKLAKAMREEFPNAVAFTEAHVAGIRSQFNNGKRPSQEGQSPVKPLSRFDDDGAPIAPRTRAERGTKKTAPASKAKKAKAAPAEDEEEDVDYEEDIEEEEEEEEEEEVDEE